MTDLELPPEDSRAEALRLIDQVLAEPELDPSEQGEYALTVSHVVRLIALARQSHLDALAKRGLVLCRAEPVAWLHKDKEGRFSIPALEYRSSVESADDYFPVYAVATEGDSSALR